MQSRIRGPERSGLVVGSRRILLSFVIPVLMGTALTPGSARSQCIANPIVCENQQPGTDAWRIDGPISGDVDAEIQGYASATSVDLGGSIDFHVTVEGGNTWVIEIYRMGWYGGAGGRAMHTAGPFSGIDQGACSVVAVPATNTSVECDWSVGHTLTVPSHWTSGLYLARLEADDGYQAYVTPLPQTGTNASLEGVLLGLLLSASGVGVLVAARRRRRS